MSILISVGHSFIYSHITIRNRRAGRVAGGGPPVPSATSSNPTSASSSSTPASALVATIRVYEDNEAFEPYFHKVLKLIETMETQLQPLSRLEYARFLSYDDSVSLSSTSPFSHTLTAERLSLVRNRVKHAATMKFNRWLEKYAFTSPVAHIPSLFIIVIF